GAVPKGGPSGEAQRISSDALRRLSSWGSSRVNEFREADREETGFVSRSIGRLFRLVGGEDVDVALRPVLFVTVCGALAFSSLWSFVGIWAKTNARSERHGAGSH